MPYHNLPKAPIAGPAPEGEDDNSSGNTSTADTVVLHLSDQDCSVTIPAPIALEPIALLEQEADLPNLNESQAELLLDEQQMSSDGGSAGKGGPKKRKRVTKMTFFYMTIKA